MTKKEASVSVVNAIIDDALIGDLSPWNTKCRNYI